MIEQVNKIIITLLFIDYIILLIFISIDIIECNTNNGGCEQNCINQAGTYHCTCNEGFDLSNDKHGCDGIYKHCIHTSLQFLLS